MDVFISAQIGLPRMIKEAQSDTAEPRNLLDEDLSVNMVALSPSRPDTFETVPLYFRAKGRIVSVFGMICDLTTSMKPVSYVEFMRLDKMLDDAYQSVPQWLQIRPMSKSIMDDPKVIIDRLFVAVLFYYSKCVLHRAYMLPARADHRYKYSRTACTEYALKILELQSVVDQETRVGGRLYEVQWKISEIIRAAFLLATTILCVDLNQSWDRPLPEELERNQMIFSTLKTSYQIWIGSSSSSQEVQKVIEALRIVLGKFETSHAGKSTTDPQGDAVTEQSDITGLLPITNTPLTDSNLKGTDQNMTSNWPLEFPNMTMDDIDFVNDTLFGGIVQLTRQSRLGILRIRQGALMAC
jgi:hypothetical protein